MKQLFFIYILSSDSDEITYLYNKQQYVNYFVLKHYSRELKFYVFHIIINFTIHNNIFYVL